MSLGCSFLSLATRNTKLCFRLQLMLARHVRDRSLSLKLTSRGS